MNPREFIKAQLAAHREKQEYLQSEEYKDYLKAVGVAEANAQVRKELVTCATSPPEPSHSPPSRLSKPAVPPFERASQIVVRAVVKQQRKRRKR